MHLFFGLSIVLINFCFIIYDYISTVCIVDDVLVFFVFQLHIIYCEALFAVLLFNTGAASESYSESLESSNVFLSDLRSKMSDAVVQLPDNMHSTNHIL